MFSILDHIDKLTPDNGTQTNGSKSFECPACGAANFKIDIKTGKYNTFSCDCATTEQGKKKIREIIAPSTWEKPPRPKQTREWTYCNEADEPIVKTIRKDDGEGNRKIYQKSLVKGLEPKELEPEICLYRWAEIREAIRDENTIFWVEGEPCADALWDLGLAATTTLRGSSGYSAKYADLIPPELLVIVPDRDQPGIKYAEQIEADYPGALWLYPFPNSYLWDRLPINGGADIADWIADGATKEQILNAIGSKRTPEAQKPENTTGEVSGIAEISDTYQEKAIKDLYNHGGRYIALDKDLYRFNGKNYEILNAGEEKRRIREWAANYPVFNPRTGTYKYAYMNPASVNAIWEWALLSFGVNADQVNPPGLNLANGILRISWMNRTPQWTLEPHNPDDYYLYCSPVAYNPNANPEHCDRLLECLDPEPRTALLRTIAASLDFLNARKLYSRGIRAGILRGAGSNGKDSIRQVTILIFQDSLVSVDLADFRAYDEGKKWYLAPLQGAKVNWSSENNKGTSLDGLDSLNIAVTGEARALKKEEKNRQPTSFTPNAIHLFNVNKLPKISSGLDSIMSRFAIFDFNKTYKSNPETEKGELKADPRFKEDDRFLVEQVCPAFLNRLLDELVNFAKEGINYEALKASLEDIQEESTHLWQFVKDEGIVANATGKIYVSDLWEKLRDWYIDNETLEISESGKSEWHEQGNKWDFNITGANQIYKRFKQLFPKIDRHRDTTNPETKGRWYLSGIAFSASPASLPDSASVSASPLASLTFTSPSPSSSPDQSVKQNGEASEASGEAETLSLYSGEASEAKTTTFINSDTQTEQTIQKGDRVIPHGSARWQKKQSQPLPPYLVPKGKKDASEINIGIFEGDLFMDLTSISRVLEISSDGKRVKVMSSGGRRSVFPIEDVSLLEKAVSNSN